MSVTVPHIPLGAKEVAYEELKELDKKVLLHGHHHKLKQTREIIFSEGTCATLKDVNGNEYVDGKSGLFNVHIGHGRKEMAEVAAHQISQLQFAQNLAGYSNPSAILLADKLVTLAHTNGLTNMASVFFCSGGSEANESAYSMALRYWQMKGMKGKTRVISFYNCYHGSTFFPSSVNPINSKSYGWDRVMESTMAGSLYDKLQKPFIHVEFPNANFFDHSHIKQGESLGHAAARRLEETILREGAANICALIAEPIQGDGGVVLPHSDFWPLAREICDKYGILLIADEVMTFARTGKYFAMSHWNVKPDIITIAKGLSSGYLPLGAMMISADIKDVALDSSDTPSNFWAHDYTYSGHSTCCAVGLKNLEIMERENLVSESETKGIYLLTELTNKLPRYTNVVKEVRGQGLFIGIELKGEWAEEVEDKMAHEERVLVHHSGENMRVVVLAPSLVITYSDMNKITQGLERVLGAMNLTHAPGSK